MSKSTQLLPFIAAFLLLAVPVASAAPSAGPTLPEPETRRSAGDDGVTVEEAKFETAKNINPFMRVMPLAMGLPLGVVGISMTASSPIAYAAGDLPAYTGMRAAGLGVMGGALGANIAFNALQRASVQLTGGSWSKDVGFLIGGIALSAGGMALASVGSTPTLLVTDGAITGTLVGASTLWGFGMAFLIIDTFKSAWDHAPTFASLDRRPRVELAGIHLAPTRGGVSGGFSLRF